MRCLNILVKWGISLKPTSMAMVPTGIFVVVRRSIAREPVGRAGGQHDGAQQGPDRLEADLRDGD